METYFNDEKLDSAKESSLLKAYFCVLEYCDRISDTFGIFIACLHATLFVTFVCCLYIVVTTLPTIQETISTNEAIVYGGLFVVYLVPFIIFNHSAQKVMDLDDGIKSIILRGKKNSIGFQVKESKLDRILLQQPIRLSAYGFFNLGLFPFTEIFSKSPKFKWISVGTFLALLNVVAAFAFLATPWIFLRNFENYATVYTEQARQGSVVLQIGVVAFGFSFCIAVQLAQGKKFAKFLEDKEDFLNIVPTENNNFVQWKALLVIVLSSGLYEFSTYFGQTYQFNYKLWGSNMFYHIIILTVYIWSVTEECKNCFQSFHEQLQAYFSAGKLDSHTESELADTYFAMCEFCERITEVFGRFLAALHANFFVMFVVCLYISITTLPTAHDLISAKQTILYGGLFIVYVSPFVLFNNSAQKIMDLKLWNFAIFYHMVFLKVYIWSVTEECKNCFEGIRQQLQVYYTAGKLDLQTESELARAYFAMSDFCERITDVFGQCVAALHANMFAMFVVCLYVFINTLPKAHEISSAKQLIPYGGLFIVFVGPFVLFNNTVQKIMDMDDDIKTKVVRGKQEWPHFRTTDSRLDRILWQEPLRLTANGYFNLGRKLMTQMLGLILTYLIILLQFNGEQNTANCIPKDKQPS
ncbi:unnamed protein product [Notodromas monacha]|uniref:Gustatory receptor n=1 Tax=Notodromas monacha TaxID=399045 RepID=A0A7R9BZK9_9CRUS|nr:unnamed protein product [Notodromas monacha]CAG0923008.1 unnamed protein product [Notodromas monacha]